MEQDPKKRFSNRAAYYARYRPRYPAAILDFMKRKLGLTAVSLIADIGSGTGILSELLLSNGNTVYGVEPNDEMRTTAEKELAAFLNFKSVRGTAEDTTLLAKSIDFVAAGQAFHWFNADKAKVEFSRILRHSGWVVLIWNIRRDSTPFNQSYEQMVSKYAALPYSRHDPRDKELGGNLKSFLGDYLHETFRNSQALDYEGLLGRVQSSSYISLLEDSKYELMVSELRNLFNEYQERGFVQIEYDSELYCGQLNLED